MVACLGAVAAEPFTPVIVKGHAAHPTRILAKVRPVAQASAHASVLSASGLQAIRGYDLVPGLVVLDTVSQVQAMAAAPGGATDAEMQAANLLGRIEVLQASGLFEYVEPDYLMFADAIPSDSAFTDGTLWGLRNTGQNGGVSGIDVDAVRAWDLTTGSTNVIVAVIDSGIRYTHTDLAAQMWHNPGEIAGNGIDDDHDGYVDDVYGINAIANTGNPMDDDGHGTHVAGTIGAAANNGHAHVGVAWNVRLMALKFLPPDSGGDTADAVECVNYAVAHGATILNNSWGGGGRSRALRDAIDAAQNQGVLFVAAAGNDGQNNDVSPHYPSGYDADNVIAVTAIDRRGDRASFSDYGARSVDLGAPGVAIYSTTSTSDTSYDTYEGTSMATPHVSGVAALIRAQFPSISVADLRDRLLNTAVSTPSLAGITATGGRVNAYQALIATGDGKLEATVSPAAGATLFYGRAVPIAVRVTDLTGVAGATVTGTIGSGGSLTFFDNGVAPDAKANDGNYTGTLNVPSSGSQLTLAINATATGKTAANINPTYVLQAPPANDNFAARQTISFNNGTIETNNTGGTRETGEPLLAAKNGGASLWWTWTSPANTTVTLDTIGSDFDTMLGVFTGTSLGALTEIASNDDIDGPNQPSTVTFSVTAGTTYQIAVDGWEGATGHIVLNLLTRLPPANDNFANAILLTGAAFTTQGDISYATREAGEPVPPHGSGGGTTWWKWTAPQSGSARISFVNASSYADLDISVYTGSSVAALTRIPGRRIDETSASFNGLWFAVSAGTEYHFAIANGDSSQPASVSFTMAVVPGPANDLFANATVVSGETVTATGDTTNATTEVGESALVTAGNGNTIWWAWTAPFDGTVTVTTDANVLVTAFSGDTLDALVRVAHNYTGGHSYLDPKFKFGVVGGVTYHVTADLFGSSVTPGPRQFSWTVVSGPVNDRFINRSLLTGATVQASGTLAGASREPGEPDIAPFTGDMTVWWSWVAPATGTIELTGTGSDIWFFLFQGDDITSLQFVADSLLSGMVLRTPVIAGVEYQLQADKGYLSNSDAFGFSFRLLDSPANDQFANRVELTGDHAHVVGDNRNATVDLGEIYEHGTASVWWTWTAPTDGTGEISFTAAENDKNCTVYTGTSVPGLVEVTHGGASPGNLGNVRFAAAAGTTYQIAVDGAMGTFAFDFSLQAGPANNLFEHALNLDTAVVDVTGSNVNASRESSEPTFIAGQTTNGVVWWQWRPPSVGVVSISTAGSSFDTILAVYQGDAPDNLVEVASNDDELSTVTTSQVTFQASPLHQYFIAIDGKNGASGSIRLRLAYPHPPANDNLAAATPVTGAAWTVSGSNPAATMEPGEPAFGNYAATSSAWWTWTAPATGTATIEVDTQSFAPLLGVFTGNAINALAPVFNSDFNSAVRRSIFHAVQGTTYRIAVGVYSGLGGTFGLSLNLVNGPANDMFAGRTLLSGADASDASTLLNGTREAGELGDPGYTSCWWAWTAPASGPAYANTSAQFVCSLAVYTGSTLGNLSWVAGHSWDSYAPFTAVAGQTYILQVYDYYGSGTGTVTVHIRQSPTPANDSFASRVLLDGASVDVPGSNLSASAEPGEPVISYGGQAATVWWTWTAPANGRGEVQARDPDFPAMIGVFTGDALNNLVPVDYTNGTGNGSNPALFNAVAGTTYQIAVDGYESRAGEFTLHVAVHAPPPNDAFANRVELTGTELHVDASNQWAAAEIDDPYLGYENALATVWWTWTAPATGLLAVSATGEDFKPRPYLFTGSALASLTQVLFNSEASPAETTTRDYFQVTAGTTYQLAIDGTARYPLAMGDFSLDLVELSPPPNDNFAQRIALTGERVSADGVNIGASREGDEYYVAGSPSAHSVWWTWTAPASGAFAVSTEGSDFDTSLGVFTGTVVGGFDYIAENNDASENELTSIATFIATAGVTYQIVVDGRQDATGHIQLQVGPAAPPQSMVALPTPTVVADSAVTLTATATGFGPYTYQWLFNGVEIPGATSSEYHLASAQAYATGDYSVRVSNAFGTAGSSAVALTVDSPPPSNARLTNLSTRALDLTADKVLIPGFVIEGPGNKKLLIRAVGPTLAEAPFNLAGTLPNPRIALKRFNGSGYDDVTTNDDWGTNANVAELITRSGELGAFALADGSADAALLIDLAPGQYSVVTDDPAQQTGIAIVEFYDADNATSTSRLINISNRGYVGAGDNIMIPGFVVSSEGPKTLLIRVIGPTLGQAPFNVPGVLADPTLTIFRHDFVHNTDEEILTNDDWSVGPGADRTRDVAAQVFAFALPDGSKDAAFVVTLNPGVYTVHARGSPSTGSGQGNNTEGVALVEVYAVP